MTKPKLSQEQIDEIIVEYTTIEVNLVDIARKYNVSNWIIKSVLKKNNIKIIPHSFKNRIKYPYNEKFFLSETEKSAYFFGFMLGDGCLYINKERNMYEFTICLSKKDKHVLEYFCDWTNRSYDAIKYSNKINRVSLDFRGASLCKNNDFKKWGFVPNKTYNPVIPTIIDPKILKPFIIGLLDADGHISYGEKNNKNIIEFICNSIIVNWFVETIKNLGFRGKINYRYFKGKCYSSVSITKKQDIIDLCKILNIENYDFIFDRKWNDIKTTLKNGKYKTNNKLKFNKETVDEIINLYKSKKFSTYKLAKMYKTSRNVISKMLRGKYFSQSEYSLLHEQFKTEIIKVTNNKISNEQCEEIRKIIINKEKTIVSLSKEYNVSKTTITDIKYFRGAYKKVA